MENLSKILLPHIPISFGNYMCLMLQFATSNAVSGHLQAEFARSIKNDGDIFRVPRTHGESRDLVIGSVWTLLNVWDGYGLSR